MSVHLHGFFRSSASWRVRIALALKERLAVVEEARQAAQAQLDEIRQLPARLLAQGFSQHDNIQDQG